MEDDFEFSSGIQHLILVSTKGESRYMSSSLCGADLGLYYFFEFSTAILYYIKFSTAGGSRYMSSSIWRAGQMLYYFFKFFQQVSLFEASSTEVSHYMFSSRLRKTTSSSLQPVTSFSGSPSLGRAATRPHW